MKLKILKYKTGSFLKSNKSLRVSLPYVKAITVGIVFTVEDKAKHDIIKDFIKRLEHDNKQVKVISFLPKQKENYEFMFDFFTEKDLSFWGSLMSTTANNFAETPFDFLICPDATPNPFVMNLIARSKSKCRIGKYFEKAEPYYEMMIESKGGTKDLVDQIFKYTAALK